MICASLVITVDESVYISVTFCTVGKLISFDELIDVILSFISKVDNIVVAVVSDVAAVVTIWNVAVISVETVVTFVVELIIVGVVAMVCEVTGDTVVVAEPLVCVFVPIVADVKFIAVVSEVDALVALSTEVDVLLLVDSVLRSTVVTLMSDSALVVVSSSTIVSVSAPVDV